MKKVSIFGHDVPAGLVAIALTISAVGAASGAAASGVISGQASTEVEQALLIGAGNTASGNGVNFDGVDASVTQVADDDRSFRAGATIKQGEDFSLTIDVDNTADELLEARLVVNTDKPLELVQESTSGGNLNVQRVGQGEFIISAGKNVDSEELKLNFRAPNDIKPGFCDISVTLQPVEL